MTTYLVRTEGVKSDLEGVCCIRYGVLEYKVLVLRVAGSAPRSRCSPPHIGAQRGADVPTAEPTALDIRPIVHASPVNKTHTDPSPHVQTPQNHTLPIVVLSPTSHIKSTGHLPMFPAAISTPVLPAILP